CNKVNLQAGGPLRLLYGIIVGALLLLAPSSRAAQVNPGQPWATAGPMSVPRYGHIALLLQDGRVFVLGGVNGTATVDPKPEIFDPASTTWRSASPMPVLSGFRFTPYTATLLQTGEVLVLNDSAAAL